MSYITCKAHVLAARGRVDVRRVDDAGRVEVLVHGEHGTYGVVRNATGQWFCMCPAARLGRPCSHVLAAERVVAEQVPSWEEL